LELPSFYFDLIPAIKTEYCMQCRQEFYKALVTLTIAPPMIQPNGTRRSTAMESKRSKIARSQDVLEGASDLEEMGSSCMQGNRPKIPLKQAASKCREAKA
jgi:hypothetical protein